MTELFRAPGGEKTQLVSIPINRTLKKKKEGSKGCFPVSVFRKEHRLVSQEKHENLRKGNKN